MAEQLYFSRDSKLYVGFDSKVWEVPILDGFSFSQSTNQSEIGLSEMQGTDGLSRRGQRVFTDSLAPAEWSFSTYVRPFQTVTDAGGDGGEHRAVEEVLWAVMAGADKYQDSVSSAGGLRQGQIAITTASSDATNGTYIVNDNTTGIGGTHGAGAVGWEIEVTVSSNAISAVTVIDAGEGFAATNTITLPTSLIGGSTAGVLTVSAVTAATGGIASTTIGSGGSGRTASKSYSITNLNSSTSGNGVGYELEISTNGSGAVTVDTIRSAGTNFAASDTITVAQGIIGGSGNLVINVATLTEQGATFYRDSQPDPASPFGPTVAGPSGTGSTGKSIINFGQSNRSTLGTCDLYFVMETSSTNPMVYKLSGAAFNEASIDFEVDGIATINWSGFAANVTDMQSSSTAGSSAVVQSGKIISGTNSKTSAAFAAGDVVLDSNDGLKLGVCTAANAAAFAIDDGVGSTKTFIRNRLTQLDVTAAAADRGAFPGVSGNGKYQLTLTGGNITISNNISYLVPEELGAVNVPIEHVTGTRSASGSFTCYLTLDDSSGQNGTSVELFNDMTTQGAGKGLEKVVNNFETIFSVGGTVANTPRLNVKFPKVHINVPTHSIEDVISLETTFASYTDDFNVANEVQLEYFGVAL